MLAEKLDEKLGCPVPARGVGLLHLSTYQTICMVKQCNITDFDTYQEISGTQYVKSRFVTLQRRDAAPDLRECFTTR